jgi:hypothetical protein
MRRTTACSRIAHPGGFANGEAGRYLKEDMPINDANWLDPKTVAAIGGLTIGVAGFLYGLFRDKWSRTESRLDSLGKVLSPQVRAAQDLMQANNARRIADQLKHSFPLPRESKLAGIHTESDFPTATPEVVARVNALTKDYNELLASSQKHFREAEAELATRHFRFPTRVAKEIKLLQESLSEFGRLINNGFTDRADVQFAQFRDRYKSITDTARGWRLADPFEWIRARFRRTSKQPDEGDSEFELTKEEMDDVMELVHIRATSQAENTFAVHPPQKLIDNPEIAQSDNVIDELKESVFTAVFQNGTVKLLSFPELIAFTYNLIVLAHEWQQLEKMVAAAKPDHPTEFNLSFKFSMRDLMTTETVKALLSKIDFSNTPSDA